MDNKHQLEQDLANQNDITSKLQKDVEKLKVKSIEFERLLRPNQSGAEIKDNGVEQFLDIQQNVDEEQANSNDKKEDGQNMTEIVEEVVEKEAKTIPKNTYTFLTVSPYNSPPFLIGLLVYASQILTICLLIVNLLSNGNLLFPWNVNHTVRVAQFIAITMSIMVFEDVHSAIEQCLEGYNIAYEKSFPHASAVRFWIPAISHFCEALFVLISSWLLIVSADDIMDILLNFTAVGFISAIDKVAFQLSVLGFLGTQNMKEAIEISQTALHLPKEKESHRQRNLKISQAVLFLIYALMLGAWIYIIHAQLSGKYLCQRLSVRFQDSFSSYSGLYEMRNALVDASGRATYKKEGSSVCDSITKSTTWYPQFSFCGDTSEWTFRVDSSDSCTWLATSTVPDQYDILQTRTIPWNFNYTNEGSSSLHIDFSCFDADACINGDCPCAAGTYGITCNIKDPCSTLELKGSDTDSGFPTKLEILQSSDDVSVQAYYRPIYIETQRFLENSYNILLYAGWRWIVITNDALKGLKNTTNYADVASYFAQNKFDAACIESNFIKFISEASDDTASASTPEGLQWYEPKLDKNMKYGVLPVPHPNKVVNGVLFCPFCDNITNPCLFEGICDDVERSCDCRNGAIGELCDVPPLGNGICDQYFNTPNYKYDGGDCCGATCNVPGSCGISALEYAFGVDMAVTGDGYPNCIDPSMISVGIHIETELTYSLGITLVCGMNTYLELSHYSLFVDFHRGKEIVKIRDGIDCQLIITADTGHHIVTEPQSRSSKYPSYKVEVVKYRNNDDESGQNSSENTLLASAEGSFGAGNTNFTLPFTIIKSCFFHFLPNVSPSLFSSDTAQGKALRWLNSDISTALECDGIFPSTSDTIASFQQRYALAVLNFASAVHGTLSDDENTWLSDVSECDWRPGIVCNSDNLVTAIDLHNLGLTGSLPTEIGLLRNLVKLNIGENYLTGTIPTEFGDLVDLEQLQLYTNYFTGSIPTEIGNMKSLERFVLAMNKLHGSLPPQFGNLINLRYLLIRDTDLSGTIPSSIGNLLNISELVMGNTNITGTLPSSLGNLLDIKLLNIFESKLTGPIPTEIGHLSNLAELLLFDSALTGPIPTQLGDLQNLTKLMLSFNRLEGTIPTEVGNLSRLVMIRLENNRISGTIPLELGNLNSLESLSLSNNTLTGSMPEEVCEFKLLSLLTVDCRKINCPEACSCNGVNANNIDFPCPP